MACKPKINFNKMVESESDSDSEQEQHTRKRANTITG